MELSKLLLSVQHLLCVATCQTKRTLNEIRDFGDFIGHYRRRNTAVGLLQGQTAIATPQPKEQKMKTICITYDDESPIGGGNVVDCGNGLVTSFTWNSEYEIIDESPDTDCEDFNDNARWLMKALLEILKMEKQDPAAHCDWSADFDKHKDTGRYRFSCAITRVQP